MWTQKVKKELQNGSALLFTANQRLQRFIFNRMAPESDVFVNLPIYTLEQWHVESWMALQDNALEGTQRALLPPSQEAFIWANLVEKYAPAELLNKRKLVDSLQEARVIVYGWNIERKELMQYPATETQFLIKMLTHFERFIQSQGFITPQEALQFITKNKKNHFRKIFTYGFQDISPLLQESLSELSSELEALPQLSPVISGTQTSCAKAFHSQDDEYTAAAQWCKARLKDSPSTTIAVVVPGLESLHQPINQAFTKEFCPNFYLNPSQDEPSIPYEISASSPLSQQPVVADALMLLQIQHDQIDKQQAWALMQSKYWGASAQRTDLIEWISNSFNKKISVSKLLVELETHSSEANSFSPLDGKYFRSAIELLRKYRRITKNNDATSISHWATRILEYLETIGWPGRNDINSREYQAITQFIELVHQLASLDAVTTDQKINWNYAISALSQLCASKKFHIESVKKPIQILGPMEASGAVFDHIWLANATSEQFPARVSPNPFIPMALQRQYNTPRSTPERELDYSRLQLDGLMASSTNIVVSFSKKEGDKTFQLTKLIENRLSDIDDSLPLPSPLLHYYQDTLNYKSFDYIETIQGPEIKEGEKIPGGASHIKLHAINPMLAFLVYRLNAAAPIQASIGLTGADRGTLIHDVLAQIWAQLHSHHHLEKMDSQTLSSLVESIIEKSVNHFLAKEDRDIDPIQKTIELARTQQLITHWLTYEKSRHGFSVSAIENKTNITLCGRSLSLRIDRVDTINDSRIIMDYKTSSVTLSHLTQEPIIEPQLPLYLFGYEHNEQPIDAVCFSVISHKEITMKGVGNAELSVHSILTPDKIRNSEAPKQWPDLVEWWKQSLEKQVSGLVNGELAYCENNVQAATFYEYLTPVTRSY